MRLNRDQKHQLLTTAEAVYKGYVALDFFKTRSFTTENTKETLLELCEKAIESEQIKQIITLNGQVYELELMTDAIHAYKVSFKRPLLMTTNALRKPLNDYDTDDALTLLTQQNFYLDIDDKQQLQVVHALTDVVKLGGIGKVDLYRSHLVTLNNIIDKIKSEDDITNLLVALATGSGKTFVQALWMLIMSLSGNNAIFAVPDKLVQQFHDDLRRVLPDNYVDNLLILRENEESPLAAAVLDNLSAENTTSQIILGSSERLLDSHYQQLLDVNASRTFLCFDEQHLLMKVESRRVRLIELSKKMLSMFLTATPNEETYELSGNQPVAIMSSGQKQAAGQGQFPVLFSEYARNMTDRNTLSDYRFWTSDFWQNMVRGVLLRFANSIQQEQSSAAISIVENLPFYLHRKTGETDVRWSLQVPMARKMLCFIDDNETLVNFSNALKKSDDDTDRDVYRNGNLVSRRDIVDFFNLPNTDDELLGEDLQRKKNQYIERLAPEEMVIGNRLSSKSLKAQIKDTIFHNMIEYVLTDLTQLDEIEHNRLRKANPKAFQDLIRANFVQRTADYYKKKLEKKIDSQGAEEIADILGCLSNKLSTISPLHFNGFVDNWALDDTIIRQIKSSDWTLNDHFEEYAERHLMISVMTGMQAAETPIEESRPFLGLIENRYPMYKNGVLSVQAKSREHTSLETLNDQSFETAFTPDYLSVSEETCDNYFRLGFVGVYVSNKKTEGFSDRNLHTVINIAENKLSTTNSPETLIQGIGRNRGLDETVVPAYIHAQGRKQEALFDLDNLQSNDYYPALFKAQKSYNKQFIKILGKQVGLELIDWFTAHVDKDETIDEDKLKKQVFTIIAKSLRSINNNNSHDIQLSRSQLTQVISEAMKTLNNEIARINKPYTLSLSTKILGSFLNFICEVYYSAQRVIPALKRRLYSWFGERAPLKDEAVSQTHPEDVYLKIIKNTDFKTLLEKIGIVRELESWYVSKANGMETSIKKNIESYFKSEVQTEFQKNKKEAVIPLLSKFVVEDKRAMLIRAIENAPNLIDFFEEILELFKEIPDDDSRQEFEEKTLHLLQKIPGLEELHLGDIINYPLQVKTSLAIFNKGPLALLTNQSVQRQMIPSLAIYLSGPFLTHASGLFLEADFDVLKNVLLQEGKAEQFVKHLLNPVITSNKHLSNFETFVAEFKICFSIVSFASIKDRATEFSGNLTAEVRVIKDNPLGHLKDGIITDMALVLKKDLLPCMVNFFPLNRRELMLSEATLDKIKQLIKTEGKELMAALTGSSSTQAAVTFLSKLVTTDLPEPLDIADETAQAQQLLKKVSLRQGRVTA